MDRDRINMTIKIIDGHGKPLFIEREKGELIVGIGMAMAYMANLNIRLISSKLIKDWYNCTDEELIAREAHVSSQVGKNPYAEDYLKVIHKEMKRRSL